MRKISLLALLAASLGTASAYADVPTYSTFTITSTGDPNFSTITFTLPSAPTPDTVSTDYFIIATNVTEDGTVHNNDNLVFYDSSQAGGNPNQFGGVSDDFDLSISGAVLYNGTTSNPSFSDGTYTLTDYNTGTIDYTVNVSSTPEPSSLMLLGTGVLGLAGAARRRFIR